MKRLRQLWDIAGQVSEDEPGVIESLAALALFIGLMATVYIGTLMAYAAVAPR